MASYVLPHDLSVRTAREHSSFAPETTTAIARKLLNAAVGTPVASVDERSDVLSRAMLPQAECSFFYAGMVPGEMA